MKLGIMDLKCMGRNYNVYSTYLSSLINKTLVVFILEIFSITYPT